MSAPNEQNMSIIDRVSLLSQSIAYDCSGGRSVSTCTDCLGCCCWVPARLTCLLPWTLCDCCLSLCSGARLEWKGERKWSGSGKEPAWSLKRDMGPCSWLNCCGGNMHLSVYEEWTTYTATGVYWKPSTYYMFHQKEKDYVPRDTTKFTTRH